MAAAEPRYALTGMLRKLAWTGLSGILVAIATIAARRAAAGIWRIATGEQPPSKKT